jgi:hypothetical protein
MSNPPPIDPETPALPSSPAPTPPTLNYAVPATPNARASAHLVTIATFSSSWEAHLALGKLQSEGMPAVLIDQNMGGRGGMYAIGIGIKLQVPAVDAERALAALPKRVRATNVKCPQCGATDTRQIDFSPGVKILFLLLLGIPYLFVQKPWACLQCGHAWNMTLQETALYDEDDEDEDDEENEDMATDDRRMNTDEKQI